MFQYFLRRTLYAVPTLVVFSLVVFGLFRLTPGDPVENIYGTVSHENPDMAAVLYGNLAATLGLDKPVFYIDMRSPGQPRDLHRIFPPDRRRRLSNLAVQTADWTVVSNYDTALNRLVNTVREQVPDSLPEKALLRSACNHFYTLDRLDSLEPALAGLRAATHPEAAPVLTPQYTALAGQVAAMREKARNKPFPFPVFYWYGADNQYHHWAANFIRGKWGISRSKFQVSDSLKPSLLISLALNGSAIALAFLLAIPIGLWMARREGKPSERWAQRLLLLLYSLPVFWLGSLLLLLFSANGVGLKLIPAAGLSMWDPARQGFWQWYGQNIDQFILPVAAITLHLLALLALQMRGGILEVIRENYIRTARAKGADEGRVYRIHAFRNALSPMITLFAGLFPAVFGGALAVEYLFDIPGMGQKTQTAFSLLDYPMLMAILMISAVVTIAGNLIGDLLLALSNPKIRFTADSR